MSVLTRVPLVCAAVFSGLALADEAVRFGGIGPDPLREQGWTVGAGCTGTGDGLVTGGTGDVVSPWESLSAQEASAVLRPLERAGSGYALAGLKIAADARFFWVLQMVEAPNGQRYVELGETVAGAWQAQNSGSTRLEFRQDPDDGVAWEYGRDYRFTIRLEPDGVTGRVTDAETGKVLFAGAYAFGSAMAVTRGRPAVSTRGCRVLARELTRGGLPVAETTSDLVPEPGPAGAVLLVSGGGPRSPGGTDAGRLEAALRAEGLGVTRLTQADLGRPGLLRADRVGAVILADGSCVLAENSGRLLRYCSSGGSIVTVGGAPAGEEVHRLGDDWLALSDWASSPGLLRHPDRRVVLDFEEDLGGTWERGTDQTGTPGEIVRMPAAGGAGGFARVRTERVGSWDTYAVDLPDLSGSAEASCLHLRARNADGMTPSVAVELVESDGSRWIARADIGREWTDLLLRPGAFRFWESVEGRGGDGDFVRMNRVVRLSVGLAVTHVPVIGPAHEYDIDEVAVIPDLLADAPTAVDVDAPMMIRTYAEDHVSGVPVVRSPDGLSPMTGFEARGGFDVETALPLVSPGEGDVYPVLWAVDAHGRRRADAACIVRYRDGLFAGGTRAAFTCTNADLFADPANRARLARLCRDLVSGTLPEPSRRTENGTFVASAPAFAGDMPRLRISADGQRLETSDGKPFFAIGANYHGYFDRCWGEYLDDTYDPELIDADFRKLRAAGVNTLRLFFYRLGDDIRAGDWRKIDGVLAAARRHGLYLLVHQFGHDSTEMEDVLDVNRRLVRHLRGNPVVLGYDLRNEPTILIMNRFSYPAARRPLAHTDYLLRRGGPDAPGLHGRRPLPEGYSPEMSEEELAHAALFDRLFARYAARDSLYASTFRSDPFAAMADDGVWPEVRRVAEDLLDTYITLQAAVVREEDPEALVTLGHNWAVDFLDANRHLDFISHHVYQRPRNHEFVLDNLYTFDALRAKWPGKPITYGEFGYTNGLGTASGAPLDDRSSAVGEILHYLYPLVKGYSGSYKWMGNDPTGLRVSSPYEHMFGFYAYDGTLYGRAKPICHATRMLARYVERHGAGGELEILPAGDPMPVAFVFRGEGGTLFAGGTEFAGAGLAFVNAVPTNVMLLAEADGSFRLLASPDCTVRIRPAELFGAGAGMAAAGRLGAPARRVGEWVEVDLLEGVDVTLAPDRAGR